MNILNLIKFGRDVVPYVLVLVLATGFSGCGKNEQAAEVLRPVQSVRVKPGAGLDQAAYSGEVRARYESDLGFRIGGKIVSRLVDVGALVKKGQPLARLDPNDAALNAEGAKAQLAAAETDFGFANAELERYAGLLEKKFISQAVYEGKLNAFNSAKARLDQAHASYAVSRNQSGYTVLHADYDGVITAITAEAGQVVAAGQAVMRLARPEEKEVVISVPESRLAEIRKATQVSIALWADPEKFYRARIREISPNADAATRTFTAKVSVIDSNPAVALGMTAVVLLGLAPVGDVIMLPLTALTQDNGKPAVWVVDQQSRQVGLKQVQIAQYRENGAVISGGLKSGEIVVTAGVHKLLAGQKVQVLDEAPVASATPAAPKP